MEAYLMEKLGAKEAVSADLTAGGVETGRMDMSKGDRVTLLLSVPSHASDLDITLKQHDAASGGTSKDLQTKRSYFVKLAGANVFTRKEQSALSANIVEADFNGAAGVVAIEVLGEDLDRDNSFSHISAVFGARAVTVVGFFIADEMRQKPAYKVIL